MKTSSIPWLLLLTLAACKKETELDKLPDATQEGKNTFGCLVDGKAFVPKPGQAISITTRQPLEAYVYKKYIYISARGEGGIDIILYNAFQPGKYALADVSTGSNGYYQNNSGQYFTNNTQSGEVILTHIDTVHKILSGNFQFSADGISNARGKNIKITDGRFDVRLK